MSLVEIWERQERFNAKVLRERGFDLRKLSQRERVELLKEFVLHAEGELHELLGETDWKMHRRRGSDVAGFDPARSNLLEEYVDVLKYVVGIANVLDLGAVEVFAEFERKSDVVEARYSMERRLRALGDDQKVVGVDIDGVLNEYPADFVDYCAKVEGRFFESLPDLRGKIPARRVAELKESYRLTGRQDVVRRGARALLDGLRTQFAVVLISKRPVWRFGRIYAETLQMLAEAGLRYDAVIFHPEKHRKIREEFPHLVALVEDDPTVAEAVVAEGVPVVLVEGDLNRDVAVRERFGASPCVRVSELGEVLPAIDALRYPETTRTLGKL